MTDNIIKLDAENDLGKAEILLVTIREWLAAGMSLTLDASAVETLTLPCIQIILAAIRSHPNVTVVNPSAAFVEAFRDLALDCPMADGDLARPRRPADKARSDVNPSSEGPMPKRILTIDDSKTMRDMLMLTLASEGFDVIQAVDGQDGVDVLARERVDVVITDINMPKMDGYGVIRHMRADPAHKRVPVLVLSTESSDEKKAMARSAGATGWMVKPFDPERLLATVRKVCP